MPATMIEIAKVAGVSIATVSRVLNNVDHPISEKTRQRILKLAKELNYQPNLVARSLRLDSSSTIGIIVESMLSPFVPPIISGIQDQLKNTGYMSFIINTNEDPNLEIESIHALNNRQIDGIIFVATWDRSPALIESLTEKPYVFVHRHFETYSENSVLVDERWGGRLAVSHLANLGHRKIAYITGLEDWDASILRLEGYRDELGNRQLPYDPDLVVPGDWSVEAGVRAVNQFIQLGKLPGAIFAGNDLMALGAIYALQDRGMRVPQDISVVGYDDRAFTSFVRPAITTITLPCYEMGQTAAELLVRKIKEEIKKSPPIAVRGRLIVRESCGAGSGRRNLIEDMA